MFFEFQLWNSTLFHNKLKLVYVHIITLVVNNSPQCQIAHTCERSQHIQNVQATRITKPETRFFFARMAIKQWSITSQWWRIRVTLQEFFSLFIVCLWSTSFEIFHAQTIRVCCQKVHSSFFDFKAVISFWV